MPERVPVIYGATGFTGRLVARAALRRGLRIRLAGRDETALRALSAELPGHPEIVVADADDAFALRALAARASVVVSTVGPFAALGAGVVEACVAEGVHYVDASGEQPWVARVYDLWDARAAAAGVVLCPSAAFEVAVGDGAAALAVEGFDTVDDVSVVYAMRGFGTSRGTRASVIGVLRHGGWQRRGGVRVSERPWARQTRVHLPGSGDRRAAAFPSPEVLTIPRHVETPEVTAWMVLPDEVVAVGARLVPVATGVARTPLGDWMDRLIRRIGPEPAEAERRRSVGTVAAVAHGRTDGEVRARAVVATVEDPYGTTGELLAAAAARLLEAPPAAGARAPAEVMGGPEAFLRSAGVRLDVRDGDLGV